MRARSIALVVLLLAACGDNVPGVELDDLFAETVRARCERLLRCGLMADRDTCIAFFRAPDDDDLHAAVNAGKIHYDAASARRCLDAMEILSCDETSQDARAAIESCEQMFSGTVEDGGECALDLECTSGSCDLPLCDVDTCCSGSCLPTRFAKLGEPCTVDLDCIGDSHCDAERTCVPLGAKGAPCRLDSHCDYGLACIGATDLQAGACRALPLTGESCPYARCAELGARCNGQQTCVAVGLPGAPCETSSECSSFARCGPDHICIDVPSLGMPCEFECAGEAWCSNGTCIAPLENTTPCSADDQCISRFCQEGVIYEQCADRPVCF